VVSSASAAGYPITVIQSSVLLTEICSQERYMSSVTASACGEEVARSINFCSNAANRGPTERHYRGRA
jgi:hypothetical protein